MVRGDPTPHADRPLSAARALATADCDCRTDPELALPSTVLPRFHTHPSGFRPEIFVLIYRATINPDLGAYGKGLLSTQANLACYLFL